MRISTEIVGWLGKEAMAAVRLLARRALVAAPGLAGTRPQVVIATRGIDEFFEVCKEDKAVHGACAQVSARMVGHGRGRRAGVEGV